MNSGLAFNGPKLELSADRCGAMPPLDGESDPLQRPGLASTPNGELVPPTELNAWRRGFTPQAEIWNGRLAMVGLSVGLSVLLVARLANR
jgi:hypothetical protein